MGNTCSTNHKRARYEKKNTDAIRNGLDKVLQNRVKSSQYDFEMAKKSSSRNKTSADYGLVLVDIKKGDLNNAKKKLTKLVCKEPDNEMFLYTLAKLQFETQHFESSLVNINKLNELGNEEINTLVLSARVYIHMSLYKQAREIIRKAYANNKERQEIFLIYAFVEELLGNHTKAINLYNEVSNRKLGVSEVYINCKIGYNYIKMGNLQKADNYIKMAYCQNVNHPLVKMIRIFVFYETKNYKAAMGHVQKYLKQHTAYSDVSRSELMFIWALCYRYTTNNNLPKEEKTTIGTFKTLNDESFNVSINSKNQRSLRWLTKGFTPSPNANLIKESNLKKMKSYSSSLFDMDKRKSIEDLVTMKSHGLETFNEQFFSQYLIDSSAAFPYFFYICRYSLEHFLKENKPMVKELFKVRGKELINDFKHSRESLEFLHSILACLDEQWEEKLSLCELIIKFYDYGWDVTFERIRCLIQLGRFDEAEEHLYQSDNRYSEYAGYYYLNDLIFELRDKNIKEAILDYEEALRMESNLKQAFDRLIALYKQENDNSNIEKLYRKYFTKDDRNFNIKYSYGNFLLENDRDEEAYEVFRTITKTNKDFENSRLKMENIKKRESYRSLFKKNLLVPCHSGQLEPGHHHD